MGLAVRIAELTDAASGGHAVPAGRLYGLRELPGDDCWVDIAGTAAITGVAPKTITGWLARGGPVRNRFPSPERILYRSYWPRSEVESWRMRERQAALSGGTTRVNLADLRTVRRPGT
jgi:predicted DNA-binding transcriptional regulator AlpA